MEHDRIDSTPWSERAQGIASLLLPYCDQQPTAREFHELRFSLKTFYKGKLVSEQTVRNLLHAYRSHGIDGLEPKAHRDRGQTTLPPLLTQYIRDLLITKRFSLKKVREKAQSYAREQLGIHSGIPTYAQVYFINNSIPADLKTIGQKGVQAYRREFEMSERFEAEYANQLVHFDNHRLDILVKNKQTGKLYRPWITVALDDHSRAILGITFHKRDPTSKGVALTFHHAILPKTDERWIMCGLFDSTYFDSGKEYLSYHIKSVALHLGITIYVHEQYHPESKGKLEQFFDTLEEDCLSEFDEEGYIGSNPKERRTHHKKYHTDDTIFEYIKEWIVATYHNRIHSTTRMTPKQRWLVSANERLIRMLEPKHDRDLDFLLENKPRLVYKQGIRNNNADYMDDDHTLARWIGKKVTIYFDRDNRDELFVYVQNDQNDNKLSYLCTARRRITRAMNPADRRKIAAEKQERRAPRVAEVRASRERIASIERENKKKSAKKPSKERSEQHTSEITDRPKEQSRSFSAPIIHRLWELTGEDPT